MVLCTSPQGKVPNKREEPGDGPQMQAGSNPSTFRYSGPPPSLEDCLARFGKLIDERAKERGPPLRMHHRAVFGTGIGGRSKFCRYWLSTPGESKGKSSHVLRHFAGEDETSPKPGEHAYAYATPNTPPPPPHPRPPMNLSSVASLISCSRVPCGKIRQRVANA